MIRCIVLVLAVVVCEGSVFAQASVEAGLGAAGAATATAPVARGIGSSMSGIASSLGKAVQGAGQTDSAPAAASTISPSKTAKGKTAPAKKAAPAAAVPTVPPAPPKVYEDPLNIKAGLTYDDLVSRFGPPAMEFSTGSDSRTLTYAGKAGVIQVECQGGKVASVAKPNS